MRIGLIALAAVATCAAVASADVLLGSFEGSLASPLTDANWALRNNVASLNTGAAAANFGYFPLGATEGSSSMRIRVPGGFTWGLELTQGGGGGNTFRDAWNSHDALLFDVTIVGGTPTTGASPYEVFLASINSDGTGGGWQQATANLSRVDGGGENAINNEQTVTMRWNYRADGKLFPSDTSGYAQLNIATNGGNFDIAPYGYFDNVRLVVVPEPASLSALAGSVLVRRRRR
jgi:hypothetical protein